MMMTLFVDASWCPRTKAAGVGAWCKKGGWDRGYTLGSEMQQCKDSTYAELLGIIQTLEFLSQHNEFEDLDYLLIQSDCLYALHALIKYGGFEAARKIHRSDSETGAKASNASPEFRELAERASFVTRGINVKAVRHVKGHREGVSSRSWVNEKCDALAKHHMRKARAEAYGRAGMENKRLRERDLSSRVETT